MPERLDVVRYVTLVVCETHGLGLISLVEQVLPCQVKKRVQRGVVFPTR